MKKLTALLLLSCFPCLFINGEQSQPARGVTLNGGINFSFNLIDAKSQSDTQTNKMYLLYAALELAIETSRFLTLGVSVGFNQSYGKSSINFTQLPQSLGLNGDKFSGPLFGIHAQSEFFSKGNFSLKAKGEFLYASELSKQWPITLPIVTGTATGKNHFYLATLDVLMQVKVSHGLTLFAGPRANLFSDTYTLQETIQALAGAQTLKFKQKQILGLTFGGSSEWSGRWKIIFQASLVSRLAVSAQLVHRF